MQAIRQYYIKWEAGDIPAANKVLTENPQLKQMIINAESLNKLRDIVISLERYYLNDVQSYLVNIVKYKSDWNSITRYTKYDVVTYVNKGAIESYMGIKTEIPIGTLPTNITCFVSLKLRGEQGASGTGMAPRGSWSSIAQYYKDDCVAYNNVLWYAKQDSVGNTPQELSADWDALLRFPQQVVFSQSQPSNQNTGDIWFKILSNNIYEGYRKITNGTYELILMNANHAITAGSSTTATRANTAAIADNATKAYGKAENALSVNYAASAGNATSATSATSATTAAIANAITWGNVSGKPGFVSANTYKATIGTVWSGSGPWTQNITVSGVVATDNPVVDLVLSGTDATDRQRVEGWNMVSRITTYAGGITVRCLDDKPTAAIPIQIKVVR